MQKLKNFSEGKPLKWTIRFVLIPVLVALIGARFYLNGNDFATSNKSLESSQSAFSYYKDLIRGKIKIEREKILILEVGRIGEARIFDGDSKAGETNHDGTREWGYRGAKSVEYWVAIYVSKDNDNFGLGVVFVKKDGEVWEGLFLGKETDDYSKIIACPMLISKTELSDEEVKENLYLNNSPCHEVIMDDLGKRFIPIAIEALKENPKAGTDIHK